MSSLLTMYEGFAAGKNSIKFDNVPQQNYPFNLMIQIQHNQFFTDLNSRDHKKIFFDRLYAIDVMKHYRHLSEREVCIENEIVFLQKTHHDIQQLYVATGQDLIYLNEELHSKQRYKAVLNSTITAREAAVVNINPNHQDDYINLQKQRYSETNEKIQQIIEIIEAISLDRIEIINQLDQISQKINYISDCQFAIQRQKSNMVKIIRSKSTILPERAFVSLCKEEEEEIKQAHNTFHKKIRAQITAPSTCTSGQLKQIAVQHIQISTEISDFQQKFQAITELDQFKAYKNYQGTSQEEQQKLVIALCTQIMYIYCKGISRIPSQILEELSDAFQKTELNPAQAKKIITNLQVMSIATNKI